jgi:hypothetical protein
MKLQYPASIIALHFPPTISAEHSMAQMNRMLTLSEHFSTKHP